MIMPMLREMREETRQGFAELRGEMRSRFDEVEARVCAVERLIKAQREAFEGESILGRYAAKEVEGHLSALLERKVEARRDRGRRAQAPLS